MEMLAYMQFEFIPEECSFLHITHLFLNLRYSFSHFCILSIEPLDFILFAETYKQVSFTMLLLDGFLCHVGIDSAMTGVRFLRNIM